MNSEKWFLCKKSMEIVELYLFISGKFVFSLQLPLYFWLPVLFENTFKVGERDSKHFPMSSGAHLGG